MENEVKDYRWLLKQYPEYMNKEQMYKVLHVSKRTALAYLMDGVIPCECIPGRKTHSYRIRTKDVICFMKYRDKHPKDFVKRRKRNGTKIAEKDIMEALELVLDEYPDVLSISQVSQATGYGNGAINRWCEKGQIEYLESRGSRYIPRVSLVEYVQSYRTQRLTQHACEHILKRAYTIRIDRAVGRDNHNYYENHDE